MAKGNFVLTVAYLHSVNTTSIVLGDCYERVHLHSADKSSHIDEEIVEYLKTNHQILDTLDFIMDVESRVIPLGEDFHGELVKCYYISLNGNTVGKITPEHYDFDKLKEIWAGYTA